MLPGRRETHKLTLMGTAPDSTDDHPVALDYQTLDLGLSLE
jgi:hypothetical protein